MTVLASALPATAFAQAAGQSVGQVETLKGTATATHTDSTVSNLRIGAPVRRGDLLQTGPASTLGVTFVDRSVFSLSANASMVINDLVYDPNGSSNTMLVDLAEGSFVFLTGQIAARGDMRVATPVANVGIRGTLPWIRIDAETSFMILSERNGTTGEYVLLRKATGNPIATVNLASVGTTRKYVMASPTDDPRLLDKTPEDFRQEQIVKAAIFNTLDVRDARLGVPPGRVPDDGPQPPSDRGALPPGGTDTGTTDLAGTERPGSQRLVRDTRSIAARFVAFDLFYHRDFVPRTRLWTADFNSGSGTDFELGPDHVSGVGGSIGARIPLEGLDTGRDLFSDIRFGVKQSDGTSRTTFVQPAGQEQVVGGIAGTGAPFGLNAITTFHTDHGSLSIEGEAGVGIELVANRDRTVWAAVNLNGQYRSTDIDIDYATGPVGGPFFNNFTTIDAHEIILRPTVGLGGTAIVPGTGDRLEINGAVSIGPSIHFGAFDISDCGSTDGTGGPCNGGFFRTATSARSTDVGLYAAVDAGLVARIAKKIRIEVSGGVSVEPFYRHDLNTDIAITPGAVLSFGGAEQELRSGVTARGSVRAIIPF